MVLPMAVGGEGGLALAAEALSDGGLRSEPQDGQAENQAGRQNRSGLDHGAPGEASIFLDCQRNLLICQVFLLHSSA